ncbi:hypothetical protein HY483_01220 [Candidatus Woesearchaeota archaeon]|nr:hypothetical protein [Candidatus Woesearchaeota archaeon]
MDERRTEVSRELDSYLSQRKSGGGWKGWFSTSNEQPQGRLNIKGSQMVQQVQEAVVQQTEQEPQAVQLSETQESQEYKEASQKKTFLHKIFGGLRKNPSKEEAEKVEDMVVKQETDAAQDIQELARITLRVLKHLPDEELAEYKSSEDFDRMKDLLRKHKIIK